MAFIARIFMKLAITQYIFVGICTAFIFLSRMKSRKFEPVLLTSLSEVWGLSLHRISLGLVKTCWKYEYKYIYASQVRYECHCADFGETRVWWTAFYKEILYRSSWKSGRRFSRWYYLRRRRMDVACT
jgi:hypothetical protein